MQTRVLRIVMAGVAALAFALPSSSSAASIILDDFNVNEGKFTSVPTASGSTAGLLTSSTADRTTINPLEGCGCEQLVLNTNGAATARLRFLAGGGTPANNTAFPTSAGTDGWIGFYVRTTNVGWTAQLWIEGPSNNGSAQKAIIPDGQWHLYEWDLDNTAGDQDGWGDIQGILGGNLTVADGNHTIDSIILRGTNMEQQVNVLFVDFVAKSDSGSIAALLANPCLSVCAVSPIGPVSTNVNSVIVSGVVGAASTITVYQNTGPGETMVPIGTKTTGITAGNNVVTVSGLVKTARVVATQTVGGQESCIPSAANGVVVGGGANPSVRVALSIRETTSTGPAGNPGDSLSTAIHFLGGTAVASGAPINADPVYPSNGWQTVTFYRGTNEVIGDSANATNTLVDATGYNPNDFVAIQAFAYRTLANGVTIYSANPAQTSDVTSNDVFAVNWAWDAVPGAEGYRLLRQINNSGFVDYTDVPVNNFSDNATAWLPNGTVTPSTAQSGKSIQWNPAISNTNNLPGSWGILESIAFVIHDTESTGPFDFYIDDLKNGNTVIQSFETAPAKTADYAFRQPSFSGTTSGGLLLAPNVGEVSNAAADNGTKSFRVSFQFNGTNSTRWLRFTTSGVNNPQVNLNEPISFRLLMQPVGATPPTPPPAPVITANDLGGKIVLNWPGGHRLQTSVNVAGTYTNLTKTLSPNVWTNITLGAYLSPLTNTLPEATRFFRLQD